MVTNLTILYLLVIILECKSVTRLPGFNHDRSCLLQVGLIYKNYSENPKSAENLALLYTNHLTHAHLSQLVVKNLSPTYLKRSSGEHKLWKTKITCAEVVIFDYFTNLAIFAELRALALQTNVVLYYVIASPIVQPLLPVGFLKRFSIYRAPVYMIFFDFLDTNLNFRDVVKAGLISSEYLELEQISVKEENRNYPVTPTALELKQSRSRIELNQNLYKLMLNQGWWKTLMDFDCENHRFFISKKSPCFPPYGPLLIISRKLNFTFTSPRYVHI